MTERQRRDSVRAWIENGARVTVKTYAKRYGVHADTARNELTRIGIDTTSLARRRPIRPAKGPRRRQARPLIDDPIYDDLVMVDGRLFYIAGYTAGGYPYGAFVDETPTDGDNGTRQPDDLPF